jgi:secondary thiamine-phosphate synthase enzyme
MKTLVFDSVARHVRLRLASNHPTQFIDLTADVESIVAARGAWTGLVLVQTRHTTTAIVVNEHEPLLLRDMAEMLERLAPAGAAYRHDDGLARTANVIAGERRNGHAHCQALLLGTSVVLAVVDGHLQLGHWQRIFLVELDGPQTREVSVLLTGGGER